MCRPNHAPTLSLAIALGLVSTAFLPMLHRAALGQSLVPVGDTFQVNTSPAVIGPQSPPDVLLEPDGSFVVIWQESLTDVYLRRFAAASSAARDGDISAKRFEADGSPTGAEQLVLPDAEYQEPKLIGATDSSGKFVPWAIVYDNTLKGHNVRNLDGPPTIVSETDYGQFDAISRGNRSWLSCRVSDHVIAIELDVDLNQGAVSTLEPLSYLGEWTAGPVSIDLPEQLRRGGLDDPRYEIAGGGSPPPSLLVTVLTFHPTLPQSIIEGRLFDDQGNQVGNELRIDPAGLDSFKQDLAMAVTTSGVAMVLWEEHILGRQPVFRLVDGSGPIGDGLFVSDTVEFTFKNPHAAVAASNDLFVVVWAREGESGGLDAVVARLIDASDPANPIFGDEVVVSDSSPSGRRFDPAVTADGEGNVVIVWVRETADRSDSSIYARRLEIGVDPEVFADGFESGSTTRWSAATQ